MAANHHLVILFGAGATRGAFKKRVPPPPLDQDFFDIAGQLTGRGTQVLAKRVLKDVFELYRRVTRIGLEHYFRDIEARAEIGIFAKSKNKPKDWARRQRDLVELIRRVMIHTTCDMTNAPARASAALPATESSAVKLSEISLVRSVRISFRRIAASCEVLHAILKDTHDIAQRITRKYLGWIRERVTCSCTIRPTLPTMRRLSLLPTVGVCRSRL